MNYNRLRVQKRMQQVLSEVIFREVRQQELKQVTITEVELTRDYSYATIYFHSHEMKNSEDERFLLELMEKCSGFFRKRLAETIRLRKTPELRFKIDTAFAHSERMEALFQQIAEGKKEETHDNDEDRDS